MDRQTMELSKIKRPEQYRKSMNTAKLNELAASIREKGILQNVIVNKKGNDHFLVVGYRRCAAAELAGLDRVPVDIKENLSEAEVREIRLIENDQREDVNPLDQAIEYKGQIETGNHTVETLAGRLGRTSSYVYGRLKIAELPDKLHSQIRTAIEKGLITDSHLLVLVRLKTLQAQKDLLSQMTQGSGLTVRGANEAVKRYGMTLDNATFDVADCKECPYQSANQSALFPELKKTSECMDKGCFEKKTIARCKVVLSEKEAAGFKIVTDPEEIAKLENYNSRSARQILGPGEKAQSHGYVERPKKYKTECSKCNEHHVFYLKVPQYQSDHYEVKGFCLNLKCLDEMQGRARGNDNGGTPKRDISASATRHAEDCRNRFLHAYIPAQIEASPLLQKRLCIFNTIKRLMKNDEVFMEIINKYVKMPKNDYDFDGSRLYGLIAQIPSGKIDEALSAIMSASVTATEPMALCVLMSEAELSLDKHFAVDEEYLKTKNKEELRAFITKQKIPVEFSEKDKKSEMIGKILKTDLIGKVPLDVASVSKTKAIKAASKREQGGEES